MQFTQESKGQDGAVLSLQGSFTFKDHHTFRALLDSLKASTGRNHVLDLSGLEFLDSAALGMLMIADDEARAGGWSLTLRKPTKVVGRMLELSFMSSIFAIEP